MATLRGQQALQYLQTHPEYMTGQTTPQYSGLGKVLRGIENIPLLGALLSPLTGTIGNISDLVPYAVGSLIDPEGKRINLSTYKAGYNPELFAQAQGVFDKSGASDFDYYKRLLGTQLRATAPALQTAAMTMPFKTTSVLGKPISGATARGRILQGVLGGIAPGATWGGLEGVKRGESGGNVLKDIALGGVGGGIGGGLFATGGEVVRGLKIKNLQRKPEIIASKYGSVEPYPVNETSIPGRMLQKRAQEQGITVDELIRSDPLQRLQNLTAKQIANKQFTEEEIGLLKAFSKSSDKNIAQQTNLLLDKSGLGKQVAKTTGLSVKGKQLQIDTMTAPVTTTYPRNNLANNKKIAEKVIDLLDDEGYKISNTTKNVENLSKLGEKLANDRNELLVNAKYSISGQDLAGKVSTSQEVMKLPLDDSNVKDALRVLQYEEVPVTIKNEVGNFQLSDTTKVFKAKDIQNLISRLDDEIYKNNGMMYNSNKAEALKAVRDVLSRELKSNPDIGLQYKAIQGKLSPIQKYINEGHAGAAIRRTQGADVFGGKTLVKQVPILNQLPGEWLSYGQSKVGGLMRKSPNINLSGINKMADILQSPALKQLSRNKIVSGLSNLGSKVVPISMSKLLSSGRTMSPALLGEMTNEGTMGDVLGMTTNLPIGLAKNQMGGYGNIYANTPTDLGMTEGQLRGLGGLSGQGQNRMALTLALLQSGMSVSDTKNLLGLLGLGESETKTKAMTKDQANAKSGIQSINSISQILSTSPQQLTLSKLPFSPGARTLKFEMDNVKDVLARLRTGAVISKNEEVMYSRFIPSPLDNKETIAIKLNTLRDLFNTIYTGGVEDTGITNYNPYEMEV